MPANEQTWRDQKLLHVVFGVTSIVMLLSTIWMLAKDHSREWKNYQRRFQRLEAYTADARLSEEETADYYAKEKELEHLVAVARSSAPPAEVVDSFVEEAKKKASDKNVGSRYTYRVDRIEKAQEELAKARRSARSRGGAKDGEEGSTDGIAESERAGVIERRNELIAAMQDVLSRAKQVEDNAQRELKFKRAHLDGVRSEYDIGVNEGMGEAQLAGIEDRVRVIEREINGDGDAVYGLLSAAQDAKTHREKLQKLLDRATADEALAQKALADHQADIKRVETTLAERRENLGKSFLEMPVVDAFGRPLKIDNIWLPQLTWNNNFRDVARFDRCTTCHQGIEKTAPGSAVKPGYPTTERIELTLATPSERPDLTEEQKLRLREIKGDEAVAEQELQYTLVQAYGLEIAKHGLFNAGDVTVTVVRPKSPAATARLEPGDVIEQINDVKLLDRSRAKSYLLDSVEWGKPLTLHVRRGTPEPYSSHPRLDLFVGSMSPHKLGEMGCSACHDGQGSATEFKWVSHTPNTPAQAEDWHRDYGWFNNHNWLFPMMPKRFNESMCLKCHHDVVELEPSERFPEPPAPKLVEGYNTIRQFGCFGCHEINGWDGPSRRRGPDLRAEPAYFAAAQSILTDRGLSDHERSLAEEVVAHPDRHEARKLLAELIKADAALVPPADEKAPQTDEKMGDEVAEQKALEMAGDAERTVPDQARLTPASHKLAGLLAADEETPGQFRKVGPSLRYVGSKLDLAFLNDWIKNPTSFRPSTKMPRFFGLWDHLVPQEKVDERGNPITDENGHPVMVESQGRKDAELFEPVEIRAIAEYLLDRSEPFQYVERYEGVSEKASAERGKELFSTRGCLACHQHKDFPDGKQSQGPDLSRIGSKLTTKDGQRWLYSWVREPNRYHARTVMPNLFLEPITAADGDVSDPADDITAYLLASQDDWKPAPVGEVNKGALEQLAFIYLKGSFTERQAVRFAKDGIPSDLAADIKGDEQLLLRADGDSDGDLAKKKLLYVGRRTISRLGCNGCHDIPGFEDAKPIGTGLADWGRKDTSKLAFEMVVEYLREHPPGHAHAGDGHAHEHEGAAKEGEHHSLDPAEMEPNTGFFVEALLHHQREGFIWQKLREPRSYDFKKTENKEYTDRLRMPKFNFDQEQIEAVMTFVLGLVAEPPAAKYVYKSSPRRKAIVEGEQLLVKYNCVGCHTVKMETWEFDYDPADDSFANGPAFDDYPFLMPHFTPEQLAASKKTDRRGLGHATVTGMPVPTTEDHEPDEPLYFTLWEPVAINGHPWLVGGPEVPVMEQNLNKDKIRPYFGGDFARLLYPRAIEIGRRDNPNVKPSDVWGWVPPPLVREGQKVQTGWLHDFLLNPYPIRPAALLRMPRFNMSSDEAEKLVHYFAAVDNADYPYQYHRPGGSDYTPAADLDQYEMALKLVTDNNYCVKCHLVGDFKPKGLPAALAPNLDRIYQRLRPGYVTEWLAHPTRKLPYTGMPVNFPPRNDPNAKLRNSLYPGESEDALRGVVNLLLNYDTYMKHNMKIKSMVKEPPPQAAAGESAALDR
ncbi:MAG TPA: PDZ domain-containing protein [Pirellulales bacterium]|nr:PDZ domain-containing protein [Pirellulales bacterium]